MTVPSIPVSKRLPSGIFTMLVVVATLLVLRFVAHYLPHYFVITPESFGPDFWPRRGGLLVHLTASAVAILTGPAQLWLGERRIALRWHRSIGLAYVGAVIVGSMSAAYLAVTASGPGWGYRFGLIGLATAWLVTTGQAYREILRRNILTHRVWMIRSYTLTMAFVFVRAIDEIGIPLGWTNDAQRATIGAWACWIVPLAILELVRRRE
jgi:hypothetical protein